MLLPYRNLMGLACVYQFIDVNLLAYKNCLWQDPIWQNQIYQLVINRSNYFNRGDLSS